MSSMESAPAIIPATNAGTFRAAFAAPSPDRVSLSATSPSRPHRVASDITGTRPPHDTRLGSRQCTQLDQRFASTVRMDRRHARQTRVQREQQVEALGRPDLTDDDSRRAHPQRLAHQVAERHLAGALEPRLPGLHGHPVRMREP